MADKLLSLAYAFDKRFRYRFKLKQLFFRLLQIHYLLIHDKPYKCTAV